MMFDDDDDISDDIKKDRQTVKMETQKQKVNSTWSSDECKHFSNSAQRPTCSEW